MKTALFEMPVDGRWPMDDLNDFAQSFRLSYAYFYSISEDTDKDDDRLRLTIDKYFWIGTYQDDAFSSRIYRLIPEEGKPYVQKFQYSSPVVIVINGVLSVLTLISFATRSIIKTAREGFELYRDIDDYFYKQSLENSAKF